QNLRNREAIARITLGADHETVSHPQALTRAAVICRETIRRLKVQQSAAFGSCDRVMRSVTALDRDADPCIRERCQDVLQRIKLDVDNDEAALHKRFHDLIFILNQARGSGASAP